MRHPFTAAIASLLLMGFACPASAGRYEQLTGWAAQGPKLEPVAATYFGGAGVEEFVAVHGLDDGRVIAFGNSWGPGFPDTPKPTVLGNGKRAGLEPLVKDRKGREAPDMLSPDRTGFIVFYAPDLAAVESVVRLDWGLGSITAAAVDADGGIYITGNSSPFFDRLAKPKSVKPDPAVFDPPTDKKALRRWNRSGPSWGPIEHRGLTLAGNVFVAKLTPDAKRIEWSWVLEGFRKAPDALWLSHNGDVTFASRGVHRISENGAKLTKILDKSESNTAGLLAVNPQDGSFLWGGDRNTHTGREPWRQPYMRWYPADGGDAKHTLWAWDSKRVGGDGYRLVSDSSPRNALFTPDGQLLVTGWSDGGNSIFLRHPIDLDRANVKPASNFSTWGMKRANSLAWIMLIDDRTFDVLRWTQFVAYVPDNFATARDRGAPNFAQIDSVTLLDRGHIGFAGRTATGLIQTPDAFYEYPGDGSKSGGPFAAVFSADMKSLLYSSNLPGYKHTAISAVPRGMVVAGRTTGNDGRARPDTGEPTPTPTVRAIQQDFGGAHDAHIILLRGR